MLRTGVSRAVLTLANHLSLARRNGLLVPRDDVPALSSALESLVADDDRRRAMGAQALADADQYAVDRIAARWESLFDDLRTDPHAESH